jgi:hypothetical protein
LTWIWTDAEGRILPRADSAEAPRELSYRGDSGLLKGIWHTRIQELMRNF